MNPNVFRNLSYGVYIITTMDGDRPTGCTANSAMQVTSSPATVAVSINHDNYTNGCIKKSKKFCVNILSTDSDPALIGGFGFRSGKDVDKFEDVKYAMVEGVPVLKGTCGYIICEIENEMESSSHTVFLGKVIEGDIKNPGTIPMTYAYYHGVIKGSSPKNAPTYLPE